MEHQFILTILAKNDNDFKVCKAAIAKISNSKILVVIAINSDKDVGNLAIDKLTDNYRIEKTS